jgi:hypothetical protein
MASASEHSSTVLNKIIIPVITTVLGAAAIYFLGFNKKSTGRTDMEQMLISKDATVKAWKSFVTSQNISYKSINSLSEEYSQKFVDASKQGIEKLPPLWRDFENELLRESKKADQDVKDILKDPDIDRDFVSMLNRVLDNSKDQEDKTSGFFDKMVALAKSDRELNEKISSLQNEFTGFTEKGKKDEERMVTESETIARVLAGKYSQAFDLNELDVYVDLKKAKEKKPDEPVPVLKTGKDGQAPTDPSAGGGEVKSNNPPSENGGGSSNNNSTDYNTKSNTVEPTESLLTGQWSMTGGSGTLELSPNGKMFWVFNSKGYTSGDWALVNGKLEMNAVNPDTKKSSYLVGYLSDVTRNSFTITFMSTPKEVYYLTRKK